ncbi:histidine triad nucleotide-binding protein [Helicobacter sp. CLO-3]|uniref:histidine triad nucleotide-binding protein n=1 Tax=unclassified Helicobacter TaxID=2593540 RepID=UPI000804D698|nr:MULTISPECIES: histidine triad nucleotide-binding protein [unclassified Helicobacter]OBV28909.1 histidine triad nucleotide-binding protein [Helicobacter sp. CLO-3]OHU83910.1 histidine triad nucleotide-binding protein [Helicobacter sp. CLO-3]
MSNVFVKIVRGEIPCKKVHENDAFLAFYDINPKAAIHILAIPKRAVKDFSEATPELMQGMTSFIHEVAEIAGIKNSGYRLVTNIGEDSGQEVPHLHFHILGGEKLGGF